MKRVGCRSLIQLRYTRSTRMVLGLSPRHIPTQALQIFLWDRVSRPPFPLMGAFSPLGCLSGRAAGNTLFCKAQLKIIIIITCVLPVIMPTKKKKKKKSLCRFILAVAKIQPSMVGEVDSVFSFSVSTPEPAHFGVIYADLLRGKPGQLFASQTRYYYYYYYCVYLSNWSFE